MFQFYNKLYKKIYKLGGGGKNRGKKEDFLTQFMLTFTLPVYKLWGKIDIRKKIDLHLLTDLYISWPHET